MRRAAAALTFSLISLVLVVLTWVHVLPWGGSIAATTASFVGSFNGFVMTDKEQPRQNVIAWTAAIVGTVVMVIGTTLFLAGLIKPIPGR